MVNVVKEFIRKQKNTIITFPNRRKLNNTNFSIISNNCWGGKVYQDFGLEYNTPFVGLFLYAPCYIKLLQDLKKLLSINLVFVQESKYEEANEARKSDYYPIGVLGDIEIHFLHYKDEKEAREKWVRRIKRINWDNIFVKFCDRDLCTEDHLIEFDNLSFEHKVCFTAKKYKQVNSSVHFSEFNGRSFVENELLIYKKYFDVISWLNKRGIKVYE